MKVRTNSIILWLTLLVLPLSALSANNDRVEQNNLAPSSSVTQKVDPLVSMRQASELARKNFDGKVLNIRQERNKWRVRMDRNGTVFNIFVDTRTGAVSRTAD